MTFAAASGSCSTSNLRLLLLHLLLRNHDRFRADDLWTTCRISSGPGHLLRICKFAFTAIVLARSAIHPFSLTIPKSAVADLLASLPQSCICDF